MTKEADMIRRGLPMLGDPPARQFVFEPARASSGFDAHLDELLARVEALILGHGVFHAKLHFSTGQVALWLLHDPLRYRVHVKEEFLDPELCRVYPRSPYTVEALVPSPEIPKVLSGFKRLRAQDDQIYLRAASLNVVNGLVWLNFSCDGSYYLGYAEFLTRAAELPG
jgi:hypothetical protein